MKISVVIPTWNRRQLVCRAIRSVQEQTLPATEIVVVDDGSDDGTGQLLAREFADIKLLGQGNAGVSAARNLGLASSVGDWIAFLDSDDQWLPGKLASQAALVDSIRDIKVCHTDEIWVRNGRRVNPMKKHAKHGGDIFLYCLPLCCVSPSSVLIHRSVFDQLGGFDETLPACEDYDMWLRVFSRYHAGLVEQPMLVKYGGHPDQLSRRHWGMDRFRVTALDKLLRQSPLTTSQRIATTEMLDQKCRILANGSNKRGDKTTAKYYQALARQWLDKKPVGSDATGSARL